MRAVVSAVCAIWLALFLFFCQLVLTLLDWLSTWLLFKYAELVSSFSASVQKAEESADRQKRSSKSHSPRGDSKKPPVLYATSASPVTIALKKSSRLSSPPSPILRHDINNAFDSLRTRRWPATSTSDAPVLDRKEADNETATQTRSKKRGQHSSRTSSSYSFSSEVTSILSTEPFSSPATAHPRHYQLSALPATTCQTPRLAHRKSWSDLSCVSFSSVSFSSVPLKLNLRRTKTTVRDLPAEVMMLIFGVLPLLPGASNTDLRNCLLVCRDWEIWAAPTLWRSPIIYSRTGAQGRKGSQTGLSLPWGNPASAMWPASRISRNWSPVYLTTQPVNQYLYKLSDLRSNGLPANFYLPAKYANHVHNLDLSTGVAHVTDLTVREVAFACPNLKRLNLSGCANVTDRGMAFLARSACARRLISLNLERCVGITDIGLKELSKTCTELESLYLAGCREIGDAGVAAIARGCTRRQRQRLEGKWAGGRLRRIRLTDCALVTDAGVRELVERCGGGLLVLDLARIGRITDDVVQLMTAKCERLEWLNLARPSPLQSMISNATMAVPQTPTSLSHDFVFPVTNIQDPFAEPFSELSDYTVELITTSFPSLRLLDLSYQINISDRAVDSISRNCLSLVCLTIVGCRGITADSLRSLARLRRRSGRLGCITMGEGVGITEEEVDGITNDPEGMLSGWQKSSAAAADEAGLMRELLESSGVAGWDDLSFGFQTLVGAA